MTFNELFEALHEFVILMKMPYLHDELSFVSDREDDADSNENYNEDSDKDSDEDSDEDSDNESMFNNSDNNFIESGYES